MSADIFPCIRNTNKKNDSIINLLNQETTFPISLNRQRNAVVSYNSESGR